MSGRTTAAAAGQDDKQVCGEIEQYAASVPQKKKNKMHCNLHAERVATARLTTTPAESLAQVSSGKDAQNAAL